MRAEIDALLKDDYPPVGENDLILEYDIKLRGANGTLAHNCGSARLNMILHARLLAEAPSRFEHEFAEQVYLPVNAALYDALDAANTNDNDVNELNRTIDRTNLSLPNFTG